MYCNNCRKKIALNSDRVRMKDEKEQGLRSNQVPWAADLCWSAFFPDKKCHNPKV
jgi:hypothetical protein